MRFSKVLALGAAIALVPANAPLSAAQNSAAAKFDARASVAEIRKLLQQNYVLPETRPKLDSKLAEGLAAGRYDVADYGLFAQLINEDMSSVAHDKHLGVLIDPKTAAKLAADPGSGADDAPPSADEIRAMERRNHGLAELKLLPGNIRYLEIKGFDWAGPSTAAAYDDAFRFLRGGDAIIIDIRRNGGGSPEAVQYLVSHFLKPNQPIMTFHMGTKKADRTVSLAKLPSGRVIGKPLYVLTSGSSGSAAEEFAGHVGGFKLGELVGETTAGAGFRNEFFRVSDQLVISISVGRAVLESTGKDWEGVGIAPTIQVSAAKALDVAQVYALRRLAAAAQPEEKRQLEAAATLIAAQADPVKTALALPAYAGSYGERTVTLENGKLMYRRLEGPKVPLLAVGANEFAFEFDPVARLHFSVDGSTATGFEFVRPDGSRVAAKRTQ